MSRNDLLQEAKELGLSTIQDINLLSQGYIKVDLPKPLQHSTLSHYYIDSVLMVEIRKVRGTYYVAKESLGDYKYVEKQINPDFVRFSKRKKWDWVQDFSIF